MNIIEAFAGWMEDQSVATLGQDLFVSRAPKAPDSLYWLVGSGGSSSTRNINNGYQHTHDILIYTRDQNPKTVYDRLNTLQEMVLDEDCLDLDGYVIVSVNTAGPFTDQDLDSENRMVGLLQVTIVTYKE